MRNFYRVIFSHNVEQASDMLSMNIERLPIHLVCRVVHKKSLQNAKLRILSEAVNLLLISEKHLEAAKSGC